MSQSAIVSGYGPLPASTMLIGEAPGREEYAQGRPFVGKSGAEQRWYLSRYHLTPDAWYQTNIVKEYTPGNPDPTPAEIDYWSGELHREIAACAPSLIIAVGRFAARWFLGQSTDLETVHGTPRPWQDRNGNQIVVIPIYHPAWGLHSSDDPDSMARAILDYDYSQVARYVKCVNLGETISPITDDHAGSESYLDVSGDDLYQLLTADRPSTIALDTEGEPASPWSVQISTAPGSGYCLRCSQPDFAIGAATIQGFADDPSTLFILHDASTPTACCYDTVMCRAMGVELRRATTFNTMYAAHLLRLESRALKMLAARWAGMAMTDYGLIIGDIGRDKQLEYLSSVADLSSTLPKPAPRLIRDNAGVTSTYRPNHISKTASRILIDCLSGKTNKDGPINPYKRWRATDDLLRAEVEDVIGPMPVGTLADVDLPTAVYYAARDADATLRIYPPLLAELQRVDLL